MTNLSTIVLTTKGEVKKVTLQLEDGILTIDAIQKYFKKKDVPENVCYYEYDYKVIFVFGYKKGKKGTENKTELPDPHSGLTLFGDILIVVSLTDKWINPIPFTVEQWNSFYTDGVEEEEEEEEEILSDDDKLLSNDDKIRFSSNARIEIENNFSLLQFSEKYANVIMTIQKANQINFISTLVLFILNTANVVRFKIQKKLKYF